MRSAVIAAAFAAGAIAVPMENVEKRQVTVTAVNMEYVTNIVTVTEGGDAPAATAVAYVTASASSQAAPAWNWPHWGHGHRHSHSAASPAPSVESSSEAAPAPATSEAPAGYTSAWTSYFTSLYTSAESSAAAPTSEAPAPYSAPAPTTQAASSQAPAPSAPASSAAAPSSYAASSTSVAAAATATTYQEAVVNHHNYHRSNHSSPDVAWNSTLASIAKEIAGSCNYAHNTQAGGGGYGQNIAAGADISDISMVITSQFYNNEVTNFTANGLYGQAQPDMTDFESWGHFSQVVWKDTTSVGCYTMDCSASGLSGASSSGGYQIAPYFTVCNYYPPGNYDNEYADNVGKSLNQASIAGDYNVDCDVITDPSV